MIENQGRRIGDNSDPAPYDFGGAWQPSEIELTRRVARRKRNQRNALIAAGSSAVVIGSLIVVLVTSPGWIALRDTFFKWAYGVEILPKILLGFTTNMTLTVIAGSSVAVIGLMIALIRTSRTPALTPFRFLAMIYVDGFNCFNLKLICSLSAGDGLF